MNAYFMPGQNVSLLRDYNMGIYTPLYAFDNAQIANTSLYGNGTAGNPYVLDNYQVMPISSLFEEFNIYFLDTERCILFGENTDSPVPYQYMEFLISRSGN